MHISEDWDQMRGKHDVKVVAVLVLRYTFGHGGAVGSQQISASFMMNIFATGPLKNFRLSCLYSEAAPWVVACFPS